MLVSLQDKKSLNLGPDDNLHIEGFALNVFAKADKQDRAGRADKYDKFLHLYDNWIMYFLLKIFFEIKCSCCLLG